MDQIVRHVWVGTQYDAAHAPENFQVLNVMWDGEPCVSGRGTRIETTHVRDGYHPKLDVEKMDEAADWIHALVKAGQHVLVHCAFGVERSPLTVAWYLARHGGMNLRQAYEVVLLKRPDARCRTSWIPKEIWEADALPERKLAA